MRIKQRPISPTRVAVKLNDVNVTANDCVLAIDPKIEYNASDIKYNILKDDRYADKSVKTQIYRKLTYKTPFYCAADTADNFTKLISYYDKHFLPCGLKRFGNVSYDVIEYVLDDNWINNNNVAYIHYQEHTDTERINSAKGNFKLDFSTQNGMFLDMEYTGIDEGVISTNTYASPTEFAPRPVFQMVGFKLFPAAGDEIDYYLPCRQYTFDFGSAVDTLDDCTGAYGIGGFYSGNKLDNQKVSFDVAAPLKTTDSNIDEDNFPWHSYYKAGAIMQYKLFLPGFGAEGSGLWKPRIYGTFQIENVERSDDKNLRRLKINGISIPYGGSHAWRFRLERDT